jgi:hyaluronate lyase
VAASNIAAILFEIMRRVLLLLILPLLARADAFDDLRVRWRQMLTGGAAPDTSIAQVRSALASIESAGRSRWTSLQKSSTRTSLWTDLASTTVSSQVSSNYSRVRDMALAWATPGQALHQDAGLAADTIAALDWLDANRYNARSTEYDNWWDWEIGTPALLADTAVLLYDQLDAARMARYMAAVEKFDSDPKVMIVSTVSTGANLADKVKIALLRGVLVKDAAKIAMSVSALSPVFAYVTSGDGFYTDGSFIQHTRHPYTGSYGLVLLQDVANLLYLLAGSPWDVTDPRRANVSEWATEAFAPLIFEGAMMDMVRGRAISRNSSPDHGIGHSTIAALLRLAPFVPAIRPAIKRWLLDDTSRDYSSGMALDLIPEARRLLDDGATPAADLPSASRIYASMDRAAHLRPRWAVGIAMHSSRVYNYESINSENLAGWHTGDGMTYLYTSDLTQFSDTFWPTVDPQRLPGTTVIAGSTARQSQLGGSNAVGGASLDGYTAVMMMLQPDGRQLSARKSWFLFDEEFAALGADIRSTAAGKAVETIIENRRVGASAPYASGTNWANVADIGYVMPGGQAWQTLAETRTGAWRDINAGGPTTTLTANYRTLWFDHGAQPAGAAYAYIVLPGKNAQQTQTYAGWPAVRIARNDATAQAVVNGSLGITAASFWSAGTAAGITVDATASVLVREANGQIAIGVADPTQAAAGDIHVEVDAPATALVSKDDGVMVERLAPTLRLTMAARQSRGRTFQARFARRLPRRSGR